MQPPMRSGPRCSAAAASDEMMAAGQASWSDGDWLGAWDGDRCVGNLGAFRFDTTIPGGARLPTAGYSRVGVLPTHTRQGLLTQLMHRSLREARERGQVLASLRASEAPIYGRFGYGLAGDFVRCPHHDRTERGRCAAPRATGSMRLLRCDEVFDVVPPLYERVARRWVGTIGRPEWMWKRYLKAATEPAPTPFGKGEFVAVHTDIDGVDDGYVHYETELLDEFAIAFTGSGTVHDLWGASDADRTRTLAVPVRHRSREDLAGVGATGQRSDPACAVRRPRLRDAPDLRRAVAAPPRRRRRTHRPHVRSLPPRR